MRYCSRCQVSTESCIHLERRKAPRGALLRLTAFLERHAGLLAYLFGFGVLAYVVGGVWGLW